MCYSEYREIEDEYPMPSLLNAIISYFYRTFYDCLKSAYRNSPVIFDAYISDNESIISEETFFGDMMQP
jgi:hypothetical protein